MQFLKKHYEKILLCTVLALLAGAAVWLSIQAKVEQENIEHATTEILAAPPSPVAPLDFTKFQSAVAKVKDPPGLDLGLTNHVFNPVKWVQTPPPDEKLIALRSGDEVSGAIDVKGRVPLTMTITFEGIAGAAETLKYLITIVDQGRSRNPQPNRQQVAAGDKPNRYFTLKEVKGTGVDAELIIELKDETEPISVSKGKPYVRTVGYAVNLSHKLEPNNPTVNAPLRRVNDKLTFGGEDYKIVAITEKEVVIESPSGKRYVIKDKSP